MTLEIYFNDLTPQSQGRYLKFFQLESAEDGNLDINIIPIFMLDNADLDWRAE